jgi:hypothetical protein
MDSGLALRAPRNDEGDDVGVSHDYAVPRHVVPELLHEPRPRKRRRRECRVFCCTRSLVCEVKKHTSKSLQVKPNKRHSLRDGVNAYFRALPGVRDVLVTVACEIPARRTRQGRRRQSASLAPAQGRQNHTISPSATVSHVRRYDPRPSHPASACRDDRDTPLLPRRDGVTIIINFRKPEAKYFLQGGWTRIRARSLVGQISGIKPMTLRPEFPATTTWRPPAP